MNSENKKSHKTHTVKVNTQEDVACSGEHMKGQEHPRVYLRLIAGKATCIYCGTNFIFSN